VADLGFTAYQDSTDDDLQDQITYFDVIANRRWKSLPILLLNKIDIFKENHQKYGPNYGAAIKSILDCAADLSAVW
jgi:hypothetical protein